MAVHAFVEILGRGGFAFVLLSSWPQRWAWAASVCEVLRLLLSFALSAASDGRTLTAIAPEGALRLRVAAYFMAPDVVDFCPFYCSPKLPTYFHARPLMGQLGFFLPRSGFEPMSESCTFLRDL